MVRRCCLGTALFFADPASAPNIETAAPFTFGYGAHTKLDGWVEFGFRAPSADAVELLLYDASDAKAPTTAVPVIRDASGDWGTRN
jgi:hypothetical protein